MKQSISVVYPVPPEAVLRAMTDPAFHQDKLRSMAVLSSEVLEHSSSGDRFFIRIRRTMRSDVPVPALIKKLVPAVSTLEHRDYWDADEGTGRVEIKIDGLPVELRCEMHAIRCPAGTELRHAWDVRCSLPMVGGTIERFVAGDLQRRMELEAAASRPLLDRYL